MPALWVSRRLSMGWGLKDPRYIAARYCGGVGYLCHALIQSWRQTLMMAFAPLSRVPNFSGLQSQHNLLEQLRPRGGQRVGKLDSWLVVTDQICLLASLGPAQLSNANHVLTRTIRSGKRVCADRSGWHRYTTSCLFFERYNQEQGCFRLPPATLSGKIITTPMTGRISVT